MKRYIFVLFELFISYILVAIYIPLCTSIFLILPLSKAGKIFTIPVIEESLRLISILFGGLIQYAFTVMFAIGEYINYIRYIESKTGSIPDGYYFYRFICVLVHLGLLYIQIKCYRKYQQTKHSAYIIYGFLSALTLHELYNYKIGEWIIKIVSPV